jgi:hypothetical protein
MGLKINVFARCRLFTLSSAEVLEREKKTLLLVAK